MKDKNVKSQNGKANKQSNGSKPNNSGKVNKPAEIMRAVSSVVSTAATVYSTIGKLTGKNHPEWYTKNLDNQPISINYMRNKAIPMYTTKMVPDGTAASTYTGMLTCLSYNTYVLPAIADDTFGNYNLMVDRLYQKVISLSGRTPGYTVIALRSYIFNTRVLLAYVCHGIKAFSVANHFRADDATLPDSLLSSMGFVPYSVRSNLANARTALTSMVRRMKENFPLDATIIDRTKWLFSNVFIDEPQSKPVYISINPMNRELMDPDDGGAGNVYPELGYDMWTETDTFSGPNGLMDYSEFISSLITAFEEFESTYPVYNQLRADLWRVMGGKQSRVYDELLDSLSDFVGTPPIVYDADVVAQLQNATIVSAASADTGVVTAPAPLTLGSGSGYIDLTTLFTAAPLMRYILNKRYVNLPESNASNIGVQMSTTRLVAGVSDTTTNRLDMCGTELVAQMYVWDLIHTNSGSWLNRGTPVATVYAFTPSITTASNKQAECAVRIANMAQIASAPMVVAVSGAASVVAYGICWSAGDYALMTPDVFYSLNNQALASLLDVSSGNAFKK